jgi:hypothetical protein
VTTQLQLIKIIIIIIIIIITYVEYNVIFHPYILFNVLHETKQVPVLATKYA